MTVTRATLPADSALHPHITPGDFVDCYRAACALSPRAAAELIVDMPVWAAALLRLRNLLVRPFGLHTDAPPAEDCIGMFPVELDTNQELIAGFDDSHLNFRLSVLQQDGMLYLSTWVHRNNLLGHVYLAVVLPFHILIVRNGLRRAARAPQTRSPDAV